jgi:hypothetical protein
LRYELEPSPSSDIPGQVIKADYRICRYLRVSGKMMWTTHRRIAKEVMNRLGLLPLPSVEYQRLMDGVVDPDNWNNSPHHIHRPHENKHHEIIKHLELARRYFLGNDMPNSYYNLGVALHYIQDSFTSHTISEQAHISWEKRIEESPPVSNIKEIIQITVNHEIQRRKCFFFVQELSKEVQGREETFRIATLNGRDEYALIASPEVDFYLGFWASYHVTKSILGLKNCPTLDNQLNNILSNYQNGLRMEEKKQSNEIIRLISERNKLVIRRKPQEGIIAKISNWATDRRIGSIDKDAIPNKNSYFNGDHLEKVAKGYMTEAIRTTADYGGWYNFQIPQINVKIIPMELLEVQAISKILNLSHDELRNLLGEKNIPVHVIDNNQIIRRADLDGFLGQIPINGFSRYPS